jgi:phospholipase C
MATKHPKGSLLSSIQHIVVLMLENRSFDHMLGFLYADRGNRSPSGQPFDGLTGKESNPDSNGKPVPVFQIKATDKNAYFMPGSDPGEGYSATNSQLFGSIDAPANPAASNQGFVKDFAYTLGWETQKPSWHVLPGTVANNIMGMFTPQTLPVLSTLARAYAVCDHWYCSAPTETLPNRAFANAATSQGHMDDKTKSYTCPSIFGLMSNHNVGWAIYGYNAPPLTRQNFPDTVNAPESHFGLFTDFQKAAADGTLPAYTFLEPSWESTGNSQHPNNDVAPGEQLIHDVYYAVRNGKAWKDTLLIITYDEHGGCYDHVAPPTNATPPDNSVGEFGFDFKRFGVRVPAVLVSPRIAPGTVFNVPAKSTPIDHTSILKTVETRWGLPPLTKRDAAAPHLGAVLTLAVPRVDDALKGVAVPKASGKDPAQGQPSHLQKVHADLVSSLPVPDANGGAHHEPPPLQTSADYHRYITERTAAWKEHRQQIAEQPATAAGPRIPIRKDRPAAAAKPARVKAPARRTRPTR